MNMKFRNYCLVALGEVDGIIDVVSRISETKLRKLESKGVIICTFSSVMEPNEIRDLINKEGKTFFIFEIGVDNSSYMIGREDIHTQLFGHIENGGEEVINLMTSKLMNDLTDMSVKSTGTTGNGMKIDNQENTIDVTKLSKIQKQKEIDNLLDKGFKNLNTKEKELLDLLTKNM